MKAAQLIPILAIFTLAAACSPSDSRSCELDDNCFNDERCIASFCQRAEPEPDAEQPDTPDADAPDADTDQPDTPDADQPDASTCDEGLDLCGVRCVDFETSSTFCGDCETSCPGAQSCVEGRCSSELAITTVDLEPGSGFFNALALDEHNHPHIVYHAEQSQELRYASFDGNAWNIEVVDIEVNLSDLLRLYLDDAGMAHIAYLQIGVAYDATYAHKTASGWNTESVLVPALNPVDLAPGANFQPVYSVMEAPLFDPAIFTRQGPNTWTPENLPDTENDITEIVIAGDTLSIATAYKNGNGDLLFASRDVTSEQWDRETIADAAAGFADGLRLTLASDTSPVLATLRANRTELFVYQGTLGWIPQSIPLGNNGDSAAYPYIALDATADAIVAGLHLDASNRALVLHLDPDSGEWQTPFDEHARTGSNTSVAIDTFGRTHVAFVNAQGNLTHARLP